MTKFLLALVICSMAILSTTAQQIQSPDTALVSKIKKEGLGRSQVMSILSQLTDLHGPRLTNSPKFFEAAEYVKQSLLSWGLDSVYFDQWDENFGRGWRVKKFSMQLLSPTYMPLIAYPKGWTPGIKSTRASVVYFDVKKEDDLAQYKGKLKGKIILFNPPAVLKMGFQADASRLTDSALLVLANAAVSESSIRKPALEPQRLAYLKWEFCMKEGAIAVLEPSPRFKDNIVSIGPATIPYLPEVPYHERKKPYDETAPKILPQFMIGGEQYNMLIRQVQHGIAPEIEIACDVEFTNVQPGLNVIGQIKGADKKDEVVMIGAHLDSWHVATGATDNAVGVAVMMEAIRILKSLGMQPRRTIRIGLWGGEEQGLLGSENYVKRKFGQRVDKTYPYDSIRYTPEGEKFCAYFNSDLGSGKFRGIYLQGNEEARPYFRSWFRPFEKSGTATITLKNISGTDHLSFDAIGLPGFQFIQDALEYGTTSYHSNLDVYEKASEADLKHNAVVVALVTWMAANADEKLPRKQ